MIVMNLCWNSGCAIKHSHFPDGGPMQFNDTREEVNADWWRWQMYKQVATLINNPSLEVETSLKAMIGEYRRFAMHSANPLETSYSLVRSQQSA